MAPPPYHTVYVASNVSRFTSRTQKLQCKQIRGTKVIDDELTSVFWIMSDDTAADVQPHPTKNATKRRKTVNTNAAKVAIRKERPPAKIFAPFRACHPIIRSSNYLFMLTILFSDYRSSIIHCRPIYFCSTWKDQFSDNNLCGKMSSHLRSQKRLEFGISNEASNSREHHFSLRMEGPAICGMGWWNSGEHGGCMGFQEGEES